jgi:hypothetical protein
MPALLPVRRWALTPPFHPYLIPCGPSAVYFLWHFPSLWPFGVWRPAVSRHPALRGPDFPLRPVTAVRSDCLARFSGPDYAREAANKEEKTRLRRHGLSKPVWPIPTCHGVCSERTGLRLGLGPRKGSSRMAGFPCGAALP